MKSNHPHKKLTPEQEPAFFDKLEVPYQRSKAEVWEKLSAAMDDKAVAEQKSARKIIPLSRKSTSLSLVASFLLLIGVALFARFYTKTVRVNSGQFVSHTLPDGSQVHLNAATEIAYAPYWWRFSRKVSLKGEAFFEVAKGKKFQVISERATTEVLGTSFNIRARGNVYEVYCATGKVRVKALQGNEIVLVPGELGTVEKKGAKKKTGAIKKEEVLSWRLQKFIYNTTPLAKVLQDIERHYNVKIEIDLSNVGEYNYTGLFSRRVSVEEALKIICLSFGFELERISNHSFSIKK